MACPGYLRYIVPVHRYTQFNQRIAHALTGQYYFWPKPGLTDKARLLWVLSQPLMISQRHSLNWALQNGRFAPLWLGDNRPSNVHKMTIVELHLPHRDPKCGQSREI